MHITLWVFDQCTCMYDLGFGMDVTALHMFMSKDAISWWLWDNLDYICYGLWYIYTYTYLYMLKVESWVSTVLCALMCLYVLYMLRTWLCDLWINDMIMIWFLYTYVWSVLHETIWWNHVGYDKCEMLHRITDEIWWIC